MRDKIDSYLGFAKKSRGLISGYNTCIHGINQGKIKLIIIAEDVTENGSEKLIRLAEDKKITYRRYGTKEELSKLMGFEDRGVFGIVDDNFARIILKEIDSGQYV
ncbi:MAG: ribosomal L7Ae/L30e/S12e/Gadd45 family protein [Peptostreptococcaceae bacterium]|nr:ribosomal L7Ae/L30e/S12e/Gadd45 family protein [Peptostreptococcaceae bacterium]